MGRYNHPGQLRSAMILEVYSWWEANCRGDIPDRSEFDPLERRHLLPNILIAEAELLPFRIRYRLVGTKVVEATGMDFTGRYLSELTPTDPDEPWMDDYQAAYVSRRPTIGASTIRSPRGGKYSYEFGIFPVRNGKQSVDQFIGIEDYFEFRRIGEELAPWKLKVE